MKKKNSLKLKCYLLTLLYSVSLSYGLSSSNEIKKNIEYGKIFYGSISEVKKEYYNPNSSYLAYVIDERDAKDPNMEIYNSYLIKDKDTMMYILNQLIEREMEDPSEWERTIESMYKEWRFHNICYDFGFRRYSTDSVDLNNDDEDDYNENNFITLLNKKPHSTK